MAILRRWLIRLYLSRYKFYSLLLNDYPYIYFSYRKYNIHNCDSLLFKDKGEDCPVVRGKLSSENICKGDLGINKTNPNDLIDLTYAITLPFDDFNWLYQENIAITIFSGQFSNSLLCTKSCSVFFNKTRITLRRSWCTGAQRIMVETIWLLFCLT